MKILLFSGFFKAVKNHFWGPSLFWKEGSVWQLKRLWPFLWEMRFWIFFQFFEKWNIFGENRKKNFRRTWPFFRKSHLTPKLNTNFYIVNVANLIKFTNIFFRKDLILKIHEIFKFLYKIFYQFNPFLSVVPWRGGEA